MTVKLKLVLKKEGSTVFVYRVPKEDIIYNAYSDEIAVEIDMDKLPVN